MSTLRHILQCIPAGTMGLLVVAWVLSVPFSMGVGMSGVSVGFDVGSIGCMYPSTLIGIGILRRPEVLSSCLGRFEFEQSNIQRIEIPIAIVLTVLLPISIGPLLAFRFRLWHYLAYTALVAVELAYYLRWQA